MEPQKMKWYALLFGCLLILIVLAVSNPILALAWGVKLIQYAIAIVTLYIIAKVLSGIFSKPSPSQPEKKRWPHSSLSSASAFRAPARLERAKGEKNRNQIAVLATSPSCIS